MSVPNMQLYKAISSSDTTITVVNPANIAPSKPGVIQIESELIHYQGCDTNNFFGCTRGFNGTTATSHAAGTTVMFVSTDDATGVGDLVGTTPISVANGSQTLAGQSATISHTNSPVTPGSYTSANITVDSKGHVTAAANGSGGSTPSFQQSTDTASHNVGSASFLDVPGYSVTITPGSGKSIKLTVSTIINNTSVNHNCYLTIARNGTNLGGSNGLGGQAYPGNGFAGGQFIIGGSFSFVDITPGTSPITYTLQARVDAGGAVTIGDPSTICSLIAEEIH